MEGHHRRALSWNCRRSGKISPANKETGARGRGEGGGGWWEWGRRARSRAPSPTSTKDHHQPAPSSLLQKTPSREVSPKSIKSPPKDHKSSGWSKVEQKSGKDDKSPTKSRPSSPLLSLSRPSSGGSTRPTSPFCPLGPFISALSPHSGASSPLGPSSPSYRLDSVVFWSSALFSTPSLIIDLDGRSKSLTHIDTLEEPPGMLLAGEGGRGGEGGATDKLGVPDPHSLRRRKLSLATKVSSCEYVALVLECYDEPLEEFVQAARGTTLREALERRGVEVAGIQVFAEGSRTPLPLTTDTYVLGGKTIRVRNRDDSRSPVRSRSAGTPGTHPHRKVSSTGRGQARFPWGAALSTEDCSPISGGVGLLGAGVGVLDERPNGAPSSDGSLKASSTSSRTSKQNNRWSSIFPSNAKDPKMDCLVQQLDLYSKQGIPLQPPCHTHDQEVLVEDGWRQLVSGGGQLDERQQQQQSAIWELIETEATYIHMLKVITDLFLACLCDLQQEQLLQEVDTGRLFSNIREICAANQSFWQHHVTAMIEEARTSGKPLDPTCLSHAFYKVNELFHPYTRYCMDQSRCQQYCKEKDHENEYFKLYLAWCETQKECQRLRLVDILVQPMQRLTKYSLLLKAILKKTTLEDHKLCLQEMITHVENFVSNVNSALRHKHEQERLRDIANRIEAYEAVEARDDELERVVRSYSDLSLTQPMPGCPEHMPRHLLHHGDLKLRDPHTSKMEVHAFLFTDLLLITKVTQRKAEKVKIVRPPYPVERLVLVELKDSTSLGLVSLNEWHVPVAAFTLQCPDQRTHRTWYDTLKRAKEQYREAQQSRDGLFDDVSGVAGHLAPRSPRPGSSRASRVSSLAHSHSGSIDLNENSPAASQHHPSVDMTDVRASSASSDDSVAPGPPEIQRSRSLEGGGVAAVLSSPHPDRRPSGNYPKTPNTLSVTPPYSTGQSLPNLTVESANSLRVPGSKSNGSTTTNTHKPLSPGTRGVSYPPPSPRTLRRCAPVPQSRNPPLLKSRHVTSMLQSPGQELNQGDSTGHMESDLNRSGARRCHRNDRNDNRRYHTAGAIDDIKKQDAKDSSIHKRLSWNYPPPPPPIPRDLGGDGRNDNNNKTAAKTVSCESVHSSSGVSSTSSLQRSVGSEIEGLEDIDDDNELEDEEATVVDLTVSECTSLKISPHISTTYICHDSDITLGVCSQYITQPSSSPEPSEGCENLVKIDVSESDPGISSVQITVTEGATTATSPSPSPSSGPASFPPPLTSPSAHPTPSPASCSPLLSSVKPSPSPASESPFFPISSPSINPSTTPASSSSLFSPSSSAPPSSAQQHDTPSSPDAGAPPKADMRMREILLNDASVEASDV